jgi:hypothetical protein
MHLTMPKRSSLTQRNIHRRTKYRAFAQKGRVLPPDEDVEDRHLRRHAEIVTKRKEDGIKLLTKVT